MVSVDGASFLVMDGGERLMNGLSSPLGTAGAVMGGVLSEGMV